MDSNVTDLIRDIAGSAACPLVITFFLVGAIVRWMIFGRKNH